MEEKNGHEGFGILMALVDMLPVVAFSVGAIVINIKLSSMVFGVGIALCILAGLGKVMWKMVIALTGRDVRVLFKQLRVLMPLGFLLMIVGVLLNNKRIQWSYVGAKILSFPSILFFALGALGIVAMSIFAKKLNPDDAKSNWIEQCTNILAQSCFMLGIIFAVL